MINIPNALTLLRALGVPLFLYLFLVADQPVLSFIVIVVGGVTDYLDGKLARALNQTSDFGAKFDPTVDRLYIGAVILALASRDYLPWSLVIAIIARDIVLLLVVVYQKIRRIPYLEVTYLGKAATFNLLYAFPFLLLRDADVVGSWSYILGWSFAIWGVALYFYTGLQYFVRGLRKPSAIKNVIKSIVAPFVGVLNAISDAWNNTVGKFDFKVPSWVPIIGGKTFNVPNLPRINLANFAEGGTVFPQTGGVIARVAEAGRPERIEPLDPEGLSVRDRAIIDRLSGGGGKGVVVNVYPSEGMDEKELAAIVSRQIAFATRRGAA
jgi:cardiolipin synthase